MKKNLIKVAFISAALSLTLASTAMAAEWVMQGDEWHYQLSEGNYMTNGWAMSNGMQYYLDDYGNIAKDELIENDSTYYYVGNDGAMVKDRWVELTDDSVDGGSSWYYFGSDGRAFLSKGDKTSKKEINGRYYMFDGDGRMLTGILDENGDSLNGDDNPYVDCMYFTDNTGALYMDSWVRYEDVGNSNIFSNLAQRNYSEYGEMWMYFDSNGKKVYAKNDASKTKTINGLQYMFDENGIMIPQLAVKNPTATTATQSDAVIRYGSEDTDGHIAKDEWEFVVPNEEMSAEDYHDQEYSWFWANSAGKIVKDTIKTVNGRKYIFDEIGRMQTGFCLMYDNGTFAIQYDIDEWSTDDFKADNFSSPIASIERANLYLCSPDELNDGSVQTGGEFKVDLSNSTAVFGFMNSGKAYGDKADANGCITPEKHDDKFYYHGLRLDADSDLKYGIVDLNRDLELAGVTTEPDWVVVDANGKVVKGSKKIVKDSEGNWIIIQSGKFVARISDGDKPRWHNGQYWRYDSDRKGDNRYVEPITYADHGMNNISNDFVVFGF